MSRVRHCYRCQHPIWERSDGTESCNCVVCLKCGKEEPSDENTWVYDEPTCDTCCDA